MNIVIDNCHCKVVGSEGHSCSDGIPDSRVVNDTEIAKRIVMKYIIWWSHYGDPNIRAGTFTAIMTSFMSWLDSEDGKDWLDQQE